MTVEEVVCARILQLGAVTALVSTRIYLDKLPQAPTYPAVRVQLVDDLTSQHLRGPNGLCRARVQVDAYAHEDSGVDPYAQVAALAAALHGDGLGPSASGLEGWIGELGSPPFQIVECARALRLRTYDADELKILTMSQDYLVGYHA